jgi:hypothetical protein
MSYRACHMDVSLQVLRPPHPPNGSAFSLHANAIPAEHTYCCRHHQDLDLSTGGGSTSPAFPCGMYPK